MTAAPTAQTSLADLVTANPGAVAVLTGLDLDFCCHGQRSVADACAEAHLDPAEVLALVAGSASAEAAVDVPDWAQMGAGELVDHIVSTHHAYLKATLPELTKLAAKVAEVHGERHTELMDVRIVVDEVRADLEPHLAKEEQVLFPMIRELASRTAAGSDSGAPDFHCGSIANPIRVMLLEHDRVGELLANLRHHTAGYTVPGDGCASYRALYEGLAHLEADTHLHVHKENNLLFPAVLTLEADLTAGLPHS